MLTPDISACFVFDGHHNYGVKHGVRLLRSPKGVSEMLIAGGVSAIGDHDHHVAALSLCQSVASEVDRVVKRRTAIAMKTVQQPLGSILATPKIGLLRNAPIEAI